MGLSYSGRLGRGRRGRDVVHQFAIGSRVAVGNKGRVMRVRPEWRPGVLNGTEMLFRASRDFDDISQQSVSVRTIDACYFFDDVEICQASAVENQVILARHFGDSIHRETYRLIDSD